MSPPKTSPIRDQSADSQPLQAGQHESEASESQAQPQENVFSSKGDLHDVFFSYDSSDIREDQQGIIATDVRYLTAHPEVAILIAGHADERGSSEYNVALGLQRAMAMKDALASAGISPDRMQVVSYGKEKPFCAIDTEDCYQENRRAEMLQNKE